MTYQISNFTHSPVSGMPYGSHTVINASRYRERNPTLTWNYNPWGGMPRTPREIATDPYGHILVPPGEEARTAVLMQSGCDVVFDPDLPQKQVAPLLLVIDSPAEALARALIDPEMYAHQVSKEIRNHARRVLGVTFRE